MGTKTGQPTHVFYYSTNTPLVECDVIEGERSNTSWNYRTSVESCFVWLQGVVPNPVGNNTNCSRLKIQVRRSARLLLNWGILASNVGSQTSFPYVNFLSCLEAPPRKCLGDALSTP
jgi:hypothetical protein